MLDLLLDPLFRVPLLTGALLAFVLPLFGALLMLRDEWLVALGIAHLAAASSLLGLAVGLPAVAGSLAGALAGGAIKSRLDVRGNLAYAFMILVGWAALILIAANTRLGADLGHALVEGQLYFAGPLELTAALLLAGWILVELPRLAPRLVRACLFPAQEAVDRLQSGRWHLRFDLLAASGVAIAATTLGLMGAFALVLVPAWIAFRIAPSWRWTLALSALLGGIGYLLAYLSALALDQPFGPMLVAVLVVLAALTRLRV